MAPCPPICSPRLSQLLIGQVLKSPCCCAKNIQINAPIAPTIHCAIALQREVENRCREVGPPDQPENPPPLGCQAHAVSGSEREREPDQHGKSDESQRVESRQNRMNATIAAVNISTCHRCGGQPICAGSGEYHHQHAKAKQADRAEQNVSENCDPGFPRARRIDRQRDRQADDEQERGESRRTNVMPLLSPGKCFIHHGAARTPATSLTNTIVSMTSPRRRVHGNHACDRGLMRSMVRICL
jgi:hypothetical protein